MRFPVETRVVSTKYSFNKLELICCLKVQFDFTLFVVF